MRNTGSRLSLCHSLSSTADKHGSQFWKLIPRDENCEISAANYNSYFFRRTTTFECQPASGYYWNTPGQNYETPFWNNNCFRQRFGSSANSDDQGLGRLRMRIRYWLCRVWFQIGRAPQSAEFPSWIHLLIKFDETVWCLTLRCEARTTTSRTTEKYIRLDAQLVALKCLQRAKIFLFSSWTEFRKPFELSEPTTSSRNTMDRSEPASHPPRVVRMKNPSRFSNGWENAFDEKADSSFYNPHPIPFIFTLSEIVCHCYCA